MDLSLFLAKTWGLYLLIVTSAMLVNRKNIKLLFEAYKHSTVVFFSGLIELVIGILTVLSHNIWTLDYRGLITLFGWAALLRGVIRIFAPETARKWLIKYEKSGSLMYFLSAALIFGLYLTAVGFGVL